MFYTLDAKSFEMTSISRRLDTKSFEISSISRRLDVKSFEISNMSRRLNQTTNYIVRAIRLSRSMVLKSLYELSLDYLILGPSNYALFNLPAPYSLPCDGPLDL